MKKKGFSMVEMMITVAIISFLIIVVSSSLNFIYKVRDTSKLDTIEYYKEIKNIENNVNITSTSLGDGLYLYESDSYKYIKRGN